MVSPEILRQGIVFEWMGWSATPSSLAGAGWKLNAYRDPCTFSTRMHVVLPEMRQTEYSPREYPRYGEVLQADDVNVLYSNAVRFAFAVDDMWERLGPVPVRAPLDEFVRARWEHKRHEQLIIPQESVGDLMERVVEMQQEERIQRIKKRLRERNIEDTLPDMTNVAILKTA